MNSTLLPILFTLYTCLVIVLIASPSASVTLSMQSSRTRHLSLYIALYIAFARLLANAFLDPPSNSLHYRLIVPITLPYFTQTPHPFGHGLQLRLQLPTAVDTFTLPSSSELHLLLSTHRLLPPSACTCTASGHCTIHTRPPAATISPTVLTRLHSGPDIPEPPFLATPYFDCVQYN